MQCRLLSSERVSLVTTVDLVITANGYAAIIALMDGTVQIWGIRGVHKLQRTLQCHSEALFGIAVNAGKLVTCSSDKTAKVWDWNSGEELHCLRGHEGYVRCVAITPDGSRVVTASDDETARVWDMRTGAEIWVLRGHTAYVCAVAVSPDGKYTITGSFDKTVRMWDNTTGLEVHTFQGHASRVDNICVYGANILVTGSVDNTVRVWNMWTGEELLLLQHTQPVWSVAAYKNRLFTCSDCMLWVWDLETGRLLLRHGDHWFRTAKIAKDGTRLVALTGENCLWEMRIWLKKDAVEAFCGAEYPGEAVVHKVVRFLSPHF